MNEDNVIISTGGSAVYYDAAMEHLKSIGTVLYLYASLPTILQRIGDYSKRGIVIPEGMSFAQLYNERCALYETYADVIVDCDGHAYQKLRQRLANVILTLMENN